MTGFGRGEASAKGSSVVVELRGVNSRFLEVSARLPRTLSVRESEMRDILRRHLTRGKISILVALEEDESIEVPLKINSTAARSYLRLLNDLRKSVRMRETVKLDHLLRFSEVFEVPTDSESADESVWQLVQTALADAINQFNEMRLREGQELRRDFERRIGEIERDLGEVERMSRERIPIERERLRQRIRQLMENAAVDHDRIEMEIAVLADRLDVTEEVVRFRSHDKFFLEALDGVEPAGRKLNFLIQEMNREANTIGSKSSSSEIAHIIVHVKEELEKVREQLQNIE